MSDDVLALSASLPGVAVLGKATALRANDGEEARLPERVKLFDWGENLGRTTGARIVVGEKSLLCLSENQTRFARDLVALDYEHQSVPGHPRFKEDPRHNAAHGRIEIVEGDGVYLSGLSYTPNGREHALSYADVSAVAHTDDEGNLLMVSSVALTQAGDVSGMTFSEAVAALSAASSTETPKPMDKKTDTKFRDLIISLLGLEPDEGEDMVSDEAIAAAAAKHLEKKGDDDDDAPGGDVTALSARLDAMERQHLVQSAGAQGKVIPLSAEQIDSLPIETLMSIIEKQPAGEVPTSRTGIPERPGTTEVALSAADEKVMKQLGLTKEEYLAAK
jgi:phage I-like protein